MTYPTFIRIDSRTVASEEQLDGTPDFVGVREKGKWRVKSRTSQHWEAQTFDSVGEMQAHLRKSFGGDDVARGPRR